MDIRKIIKEELGNVFSENYPMGAENHPDAPWNRDVVSPNLQAREHPFKIIGWYQENAFFEKGGKYYLFAVESVDNNDYAEYAPREELYNGRDEDGMPEVDYSDWDMDDDVIENYVNDNYKNLTYGYGVGDYENGVQMVEIDGGLLKDLMRTANYIKDERAKASYINTINTIAGAQMNESGVTDNIVNKKTMDTPTGTIFSIDFGVSGE